MFKAKNEPYCVAASGRLVPLLWRLEIVSRFVVVTYTKVPPPEASAPSSLVVQPSASHPVRGMGLRVPLDCVPNLVGEVTTLSLGQPRGTSSTTQNRVIPDKG